MGGKQEKESNVIAQEYGEKRGSYIFFLHSFDCLEGFWSHMGTSYIDAD